MSDWTPDGFIPEVTRIKTAIEDRLKAASAAGRVVPPIAEFTQFYDPENRAYPKLCLVCNEEAPSDTGGPQKVEGDFTMRLYVQQADPRFGQAAMERLAWQVLYEIGQTRGRIAPGAQFQWGKTRYGAQADDQGRPVFRADINFSLRYSEAFTEG